MRAATRFPLTPSHAGKGLIQALPRCQLTHADLRLTVRGQDNKSDAEDSCLVKAQLVVRCLLPSKQQRLLTQPSPIQLAPAGPPSRPLPPAAAASWCILRRCSCTLRRCVRMEWGGGEVGQVGTQRKQGNCWTCDISLPQQ